MELYRGRRARRASCSRVCASAIGDVVRRQAESGIDIVNDGEFGKAMRSAVDFGAWWSYVYARLAGFELQTRSRPRKAAPPGRSAARNARNSPSSTPPRRAPAAGAPAERYQHRAACTASPAPARSSTPATPPSSATSRTWPPRSRGARAEEAFMTAVSPATLQILPNALLQERGGLHLGAGRGDPRGIQGHRRRRLHPADRRSGPGRHLRLVVLDERRHRRLSQMGRRSRSRR